VIIESRASLMVTLRFLTDLDGVIEDESGWIVKSCCRDGLAGRMRSSISAWLRCG